MGVFLRALIRSVLLMFVIYLALIYIMAYVDGEPVSPLSWLMQAAFFSILFSLTMVGLEYANVQEIVAPAKPTDADMKVNQVVTVMSDMSLTQLRPLIEGEGWQVRKEEADRITFKKGISGLSWGEIIIVEKASDADEIIVRSRPWMGFTSSDFGTNLSNVRAVEKLIRSAEG